MSIGSYAHWLGTPAHETEGTAKTHVKAILTKLDAISRTEAVAVAHKRGLVHL